MANITAVVKNVSNQIESWTEDGKSYVVTRNASGKPSKVTAFQGRWPVQTTDVLYDGSGNFLTLVGTVNSLVLESVVTEATGAYAGVGGTMLPIKGEFFAQPAAFLSVPTATQTQMEFDNVIIDTLGIYNPATNIFTLPLNVIRLDWSVCIEHASVASGYGSVSGSRSVIFPATLGMGVVSVPNVNPSTGGMMLRSTGFDVLWDHGVNGSTFDIKYSQTSGATIRIGDSSGTGVAQTWIKFRLY